MTETTSEQQGQPGRFQKGRSGNPKGRPKGARHKATMAAQALLDGEAEAITRKAIEAAKEGDMTAVRLCLERLVPIKRESPVQLQLPPIRCAADLSAAVAALLDAVTSGQITPGEAQRLSSVIAHCTAALELSEIEKRLTQLEMKK